MNLYDQLRAIGAELDHHESDLYVRDAPEVREVVTQSGHSYESFTSQIDGKTWLDVPFAYTPYWQKRVQDGSQPPADNADPGDEAPGMS